MRARKGPLSALLALGLLSAPGSLRAQTPTAVVSGLVKDVTGGGIDAAGVTLTSRTQATTLTTTTDSQGRFVFPLVRPDAYTLRVTKSSFKTLERSNVVVSANDRFFAGTLTLEVGGLEESVSVSGRVSELQAASGERSLTLQSEAIQNIANNGRSPFGFVTLVPGVLQQGTGGTPPDAADGFTVNGQRPNSNNMTIDGVANIDTGTNGGYMATTNLDAVSEFKILTNAYQAEYGRAVGGQVQLVTKSGSQSFHGSGYWYGRRGAWNANSWTNKRAAAPPPVGIGTEIRPPDSARNDFGYTIGGPIYVPERFNTQKTKLFFFWSQEFQRRSDPVPERLARVPTLLERAGDFSESVDASGNPWPYVKDYATGLPCGPSDTRGCFQYQGVLGRLPPDRIYQPGLNALDIYPLPNFVGTSGINYRSQTPSHVPRREDLLRLDYHATTNWRLTGRYMNKADTQDLPYGSIGSASPSLDDVNAIQELPGWNWMVTATGILGPRTSLELSVGSAHNAIDIRATNPKLTRSGAGIGDLPLLYPEAVQQDYIPRLRFDGGRSGNTATTGQYITQSGPFSNENTTYDVVANLSQLWGAHSAKFGLYYQSSWKPQSAISASGFNGEISFVDNPSNPYDTGFGYANAATGVFTTYAQASTYAMPAWRYRNFEWYAQDNWRASSRLTLDCGVRFYVLTPQWDTTLQASTFLPEAFDAGQAARLYSPVCLGAYPCSGATLRGMDPALAGSQTPTLANTVESRFIGRLVPGANRFNGAFQAGEGVNDTLQSGTVFRVSPRLGFVYDFSGRGTTILRGGFGVFFDRPQGNSVFDMINNAPGVLQPTLQWGRLQALDTAKGEPDPTLNLSPTAYEFMPPKVYAWNVGLQRKLWHAITLDVAYVGSSSKHLLRKEPINAVPLGARFLPENQDPTRAPSALPGATALPDDFLRPYRGYSGILMWQYDGYSNYHALQASLDRRFDNGLMFGVFYVWSKALGINGDDFALGLPNASPEETRRVDYSYTSYDRPHNFVAHFVYQTPKLASGWLGVLANDWQLSGIYRWTSGRPYPVTYSIPGVGPGNLSGSDLVPRVVLTGDPGSGWGPDPYRQFDTSVFAPPQPGGDFAGSARFFLHAPPIQNLDLSISKAFAIGKQTRIEVRLDGFNALNRTQFTTVNSQVNFASLTNPTITNLPYDASGNLVRPTLGFGAISGVAPPRTLQLVTRLTF